MIDVQEIIAPPSFCTHSRDRQEAGLPWLGPSASDSYPPPRVPWYLESRWRSSSIPPGSFLDTVSHDCHVIAQDHARDRESDDRVADVDAKRDHGGTRNDSERHQPVDATMTPRRPAEPGWQGVRQPKAAPAPPPRSPGSRSHLYQRSRSPLTARAGTDTCR